MRAHLLILLVADETPSRLLPRLAAAGGDITQATTATVDQALGRGPVDAVVADFAEASRELAGLLHVLHERAPDVPVLVVVRSGGSAGAVEALRQGAFGAFPGDVDPVVLAAAVDRAAQLHALSREISRLRREGHVPRDRVPLLGRSEGMREMSRQVDELAGKTTAVVLVGASGTGKNLVARELHARSPRASKPFVAVRCAGMSDVLLESQLFGHRRGAFTAAVHDHDGAFRLASGGTLFLDRIDAMPVSLQVKLFAALQTTKALPMGATQPIDVDVRLVCATNRDLSTMVRAGTFRDDLHRRISAASLRLASLAERPEDILFLAEAFVAEEAEHYGVSARHFEPEAQAALLACSWPGNVRQLREAVQQAFVLGAGDTVRLEHLPTSVRAAARGGPTRDAERLPTLAEAEAELVALVLEESRGNKTEAARRLGIDRKRLYRKIRKYRLAAGAEDDPSSEAGEGSDEDDPD